MTAAPPEVRAALRMNRHPALAIECPHCGAHPHRPCTTPSKRHRLDQPHPSRITARESTP